MTHSKKNYDYPVEQKKTKTKSFSIIIAAYMLNPDGHVVTIIEPRHDKTCLREFPTRPDTNRPAQPQKLARVLRFRL